MKASWLASLLKLLWPDPPPAAPPPAAPPPPIDMGGWHYRVQWLPIVGGPPGCATSMPFRSLSSPNGRHYCLFTPAGRAYDSARRPIMN